MKDNWSGLNEQQIPGNLQARKIYMRRNKLGKSRAILTYGSVSLFVVAFVMLPVATALFREADIPKRLIPGCIALGAFTFTMTALPGSPQVQNTIPMTYFGTDTWAAPVLGIIAAVIMFVGGMLWLTYRSKMALKAGRGLRQS